MSLATGANGHFVVVWSDYYTNLSAVLHDASGRPLRSDFRVGAAGGSPAVAMDGRGGFVAVWSRFFFRDPGATEVVGRRFDAQGEPLSGDIELNTHTLDDQYDATVAMAEDGSFVVAWSSGEQDGDETGVFGQRFDAVGQRVSGEFQINRQTLGNQSEPSIAMSPGGDFFVAWTSSDETTNSVSVDGQYFDRHGRRVGAQVDVSTKADAFSPSAAFGANGSLVVSWSQENGGMRAIAARRFQVRNLGSGDSDGDAVPASGDNCPTIFNPEQNDVDENGYGDDCVSLDSFISPNARIGASPVIGRGATIADGVALGDDAHLGDHVSLDRGMKGGDGLTAEDFVSIGRRTTLGDGVTIGFASRLEGTVVIGSHVTIGDRVVIRRNVNIGDGATMEPLVILYAGARIGAGAVVEMGARVGRGATVEAGAVVPSGTTVPLFTTFP